MAASDLAGLACRDAVADAGLSMDQIDMVIMNTITPDHADPGCAFFLQAKLGLAGIPVFDIKQQCAGLIYGLSLADHFVRAGTCRHVLVACARSSPRGSTAPTRAATSRSSWATGRGRSWWARCRRPAGHPLHHPPRRRPTCQGPLHGRAGQRAGPQEHVIPEDSKPAASTSAWTARPSSRTASRRCPAAVVRVPPGQRPYAWPNPRAGAPPGEPPHAGSDRRAVGHFPRKGLRERRGLRQHRLGLAADRPGRGAAVGNDPPGQSRAAGGLRIGLRLGFSPSAAISGPGASGQGFAGAEAGNG